MGSQDAGQPMGMSACKDRVIDSADKRMSLDVAGGATHQTIGARTPGEAAIIEQIAAKCNAFNRHRVIRWNIQFPGKMKRYLNRIGRCMESWCGFSFFCTGSDKQKTENSE
jgi:hypothetical protein